MLRKDLLVEANSFFDVGESEDNDTLDLELLLVDIASEFIKYRVKKKISQKEMASVLNISQAMVSKLESGEYNPTIKFLFDVSQRLNWDFDVKLNSKENESVQYYSEGDNLNNIANYEYCKDIVLAS